MKKGDNELQKTFCSLLFTKHCLVTKLRSTLSSLKLKVWQSFYLFGLKAGGGGGGGGGFGEFGGIRREGVDSTYRCRGGRIRRSGCSGERRGGLGMK